MCPWHFVIIAQRIEDGYCSIGIPAFHFRQFGRKVGVCAKPCGTCPIQKLSVLVSFGMNLNRLEIAKSVVTFGHGEHVYSEHLFCLTLFSLSVECFRNTKYPEAFDLPFKSEVANRTRSVEREHEKASNLQYNPCLSVNN